MKSLSDTCESYLRTATDQWKIEGAIIPTLWAIGNGRQCFAQPKNNAAWEDDKQRTGIHALMRSIVRARLIGVIAECWVREQEPDRFVPWRGHLETVVDRDPSVRTAIIVTGYDVKRNKPRIHMARLDLDNEGSPYWEYDAHDYAEGVVVERLRIIAEHSLHEVVLQTDTTASDLESWFMMEAPYRA